MTNEKRFGSTKKAILLVVASLALGGSGLAIACGGGGHGKGMHGAEVPHFVLEEMLELTDSQSEQIKAIREEVRGERRSFTIDSKGKQGMMDVSPSDPEYIEKMEAIAKEKSEMLADRMLARARVHSQIYALLTPEQQAKMDRLREKMKGKMKRKF